MGQDAQIVLKPNDSSTLVKSVVVNGVSIPVPNGNTITLPRVMEDTNVQVEFGEPDKTMLEDLVAQVEALNEKDYTAES